jgi:hypothetical protein
MRSQVIVFEPHRQLVFDKFRDGHRYWFVVADGSVLASVMRNLDQLNWDSSVRALLRQYAY